MHFDKILVTTDLSDDSLRAFDVAAYQAKMEGTRVTLLTVLEEPLTPAALYRYLPTPETVKEIEQDVEQYTREQLSKFAEKHFHGLKIDCQVIRSKQSAAEAICDYAKRNGFNLIVLSSHGRGALGRLIMGSVAERVLRFAPCPVLIVPKNNAK